MYTMIERFKMLKEKHSDALVLFRVGNFYQTYCEDARKAAEVLGITLTKRYDKNNYYMAGFPHTELDTYLPKLIRAGLRVAICDDIFKTTEATTRQDSYEVKMEEPTETKSAKIIYPDKESEDYTPKNGTTFELEEMQGIVGGLIEIVHLNDGRLMIVNEEGLLQGLPVNIEATNILRRDHSTTQFIVGNAIVCDGDMVE